MANSKRVHKINEDYSTPCGLGLTAAEIIFKERRVSLSVDKVTCPMCLYKMGQINEEQMKDMCNREFSPVQFMKEQKDNQKTIAENMTTLGATEDCIAYAMHIITMQRGQLKKTNKKVSNDVIQSLEHKIKCQKEELRRLNGNSENDFKDAQRRTCLVKERFLKLRSVSGDRAKITINPCDGRVELKTPVDLAGDFKTMESLSRLVAKVMECDGFDPYTYRGNVYLEADRLSINLKTESKYHDSLHFNVAL